jgi:acyl carrier protein
MNTDQARETVLLALRRIAPDAEIDGLDPGSDLREAFDLDSLDFQAFTVELGRAAGTPVEDEDARHLTTLDACTAFLAGTRHSAG